MMPNIEHTMSGTVLGGLPGHSLIEQIFAECLLRAKHSARC